MFLFVTVVRIDKWNQLHDIYEMSLNSRPGSTVPDFCPVVCRFIFSLKTFYRKQSFFFFCHFPLLKPYKIQGVIITCKFQCGCVFYRTLLIITDRIHLCSRWILFRCRYLMIAGFHCGSPCSRAVARSTMISSVASCTSQREGLMMCYMFPTNVFF